MEKKKRFSLVRKVKGQIATEQMMLTGIILVMLIPIIFYITQTQTQTPYMTDTLVVLDNSVESLSNLGSGSSTTVVVQVPASVVSASFANCNTNGDYCTAIRVDYADGSQDVFEMSYFVQGSLNFLEDPGLHYVTLYHKEEDQNIIFQECGDGVQSGGEQCEACVIDDDCVAGTCEILNGETVGVCKYFSNTPCRSDGTTNYCYDHSEKYGCFCQCDIDADCLTNLCTFDQGSGDGYCEFCESDGDCPEDYYCSIGVCTDCDQDGDGEDSDFYCGGLDCNDNDVSINTGATEICTGGIDENCNGLVDCDDGDCVGDSACGECSPGDEQACGNTLGVCAGVVDTCQNDGNWGGCDYGSDYEENTETSCSDEYDNDCDGYVDCLDTDCGGGLENSGDFCSDGLDNDCDGYVDCLDADCFGFTGSSGNTCCVVGGIDGACDGDLNQCVASETYFGDSCDGCELVSGDTCESDGDFCTSSFLCDGRSPSSTFEQPDACGYCSDVCKISVDFTIGDDYCNTCDQGFQLGSNICYYDLTCMSTGWDGSAESCFEYCFDDDGTDGSCDTSQRTNPDDTSTCYYSRGCGVDGCTHVSGDLLEGYCETCGKDGINNRRGCPSYGTVYINSCYFGVDDLNRDNDCVLGNGDSMYCEGVDSESFNSLGIGCDYGSFSDGAMACSTTGDDVCYNSQDGCGIDMDGWDYEDYLCDDFDIQGEGQFYAIESEIDSNSCTIVCDGENCCERNQAICNYTYLCGKISEQITLEEVTDKFCMGIPGHGWVWQTSLDPETSCSDGYDNDCDGGVDCDDADCARDPVCNTCVPDTCGDSCGSISDGCGENLDCGACGDGFSCEYNVCVEDGSCTFDVDCGGANFCCINKACVDPGNPCLGLDCGDATDACGNVQTCGVCIFPETCVNNICEYGGGGYCGDGVLNGFEDCDGGSGVCPQGSYCLPDCTCSPA